MNLHILNKYFRVTFFWKNTLVSKLLLNNNSLFWLLETKFNHYLNHLNINSSITSYLLQIYDNDLYLNDFLYFVCGYIAFIKSANRVRSDLAGRISFSAPRNYCLLQLLYHVHTGMPGLLKNYWLLLTENRVKWFWSE